MKQWIEYVEENTPWRWNIILKRFRFQFSEGCGIDAQPEDLMGWQIRYAEECGYFIEITHAEGYDFRSWLITQPDQHSEHLGRFKTYQEAFTAAWDKFVERT